MPDAAAQHRARFWRVISRLVDPADPRQFDAGLLEELSDAWDDLQPAEQDEVLVTLRAAARGARLLVAPAGS